jgi:short-subunit dehydrogenase
MQVEKPLAVVTGASSGLGRVFARKLASEGYNLVLVARRKERLEGLAKELETRESTRAEVLPADLTIETDLAKLEERIARFDKLEFLVNNAGFGTLGRFFEADLQSQDRMHRLHVIATMRLTHAALPGMVNRRTGAIINVSSMAGFWQSPGSVSYCASKAWVNSFTEGLYLELRSIRSPVKLQALCPGFTRTEFHDAMGFDQKLIPESLWMSAEDVVVASLEALGRNQLFVVPGWRYRFLYSVMRSLPRRARHFVSIYYGRKSRRG